jgi:hypothetical protein
MATLIFIGRHSIIEMISAANQIVLGSIDNQIGLARR